MRMVMLLLVFLYSFSSDIYAQSNAKPNEQKRSVVVKKADLTVLPAKAKRFALIVGIDNYQSSQLTKLGGAVNDAKALAETLETYAGFPKEQIYLLTSSTGKIGENFSSASEANRANILRTLAIIGNSIPKDGLLLVAFSCHGMQRDKKGDKVYILPSDAQTLTTDLLEETALNVGKLKEKVLATGVEQVIFLIDACRNDPEAGKGETDNLLTKEYLKAFSFNYDEKNKDVNAFATFFASSEGERAYEDAEKKQGYFTYALIEGLKGAAANSQGEVTLINLKSYLERVVPTRVKKSTGEKQLPKIEIGGYKSESLVLSVIPKVNTSKPPEEEVTIPTGTLIIVTKEAGIKLELDGVDKGVSVANNQELKLKGHPARTVTIVAKKAGKPDKVEKFEIKPDQDNKILIGWDEIAVTPTTPTNNPSVSTVYKPAGTAVAPMIRSYSYETVTIDSKGDIKNRENKQAGYYEEDLGKGVKLEMVEVASGEFMMGSSETEVDRFSDEGPQHQVRVEGFYIGKYEVTQGQWKAIIGSNLNPSNFKGDDNLPVEKVSWEEAKEFCKKLSEKTGREYRLPSEAEWEYAARGGTRTAFGLGETITPGVVNYNGDYPYGGATKGEYRGKTVKVGSLGIANGYGLYDMAGNVWEWCEDGWHDSYKGAPTDGRVWESGADNSYRVLRGGSWLDYAYYCRSAVRGRLAPGNHDNVGFRVVVGAARTLQ